MSDEQRPALTPKQQCAVMDDVVAYVMDSVGTNYHTVAGLLYLALVNLVVQQNANDPTATLKDLHSLSDHYRQRILNAVAVTHETVQ